jgi:hypothetical protein
MDDTTFEILYKNLCMGVSQEELARLYSHDNRYNTQGKISKCVIEHGFHTGVPGYQARLARKHLLGLSREEFRSYVASYNGSSQTKLEDFYAHIDNVNKRNSAGQQTRTGQRPVRQNEQEQYRYESPQRNGGHPHSKPVSSSAASQQTIGELRRRSPDELTPQELNTLKALGYEYTRIGWRSPEQMAEDKAITEYEARKEAERRAQAKAQADHEAKMISAGYIKVGNEWDGYQWLTQKQIWEQKVVTLATEKGRLTEYVIEQIMAGRLQFDVALLGHIIPGYKVEHTYSFRAIKPEKRKLSFLPDKQIPMLMTYPSFHLLQTVTYGDDIENVNAVYLIPRGYRISRISIRGKLPVRPDRPELPDAILVTLTCEDLRKENELSENNDSATCSVCSAPIIPNSLFCSKCGNKLNR